MSLYAEQIYKAGNHARLHAGEQRRPSCVCQEQNSHTCVIT